MISGGIVFRLVTPGHPGEPSLDDPDKELQLRTEYYCFGDPSWTTDRERAHLFPTYEAARVEAKAISPRCHARLVSPPEAELPERLRHLPETASPQLQAPPPYPAKKKHAREKSKPARLDALRSSHQRVERRDWVNDKWP